MPPRRITTRQSARELRMYSSLSLNDTLPDRFVSEFSLVSEAGTKVPPTYWQYQYRFYYRRAEKWPQNLSRGLVSADQRTGYSNDTKINP